MDSAFQLCSIKNIVVVANEKAKSAFLKNVYPHFIDCIVVTANEATQYKGKFMFFGCWVEELSKYENIIMDDIIYSHWRPKPYKYPIMCPEFLATFMSHWFAQGKLRKMNNNFGWRFQHSKPVEHGKDLWLAEIMY